MIGIFRVKSQSNLFQACLVALVFVGLSEALPFNAVGPFYNGNVASKPVFDIAEHTWPGLTVKKFTMGAAH